MLKSRKRRSIDVTSEDILMNECKKDGLDLSQSIERSESSMSLSSIHLKRSSSCMSAVSMRSVGNDSAYITGNTSSIYNSSDTDDDGEQNFTQMNRKIKHKAPTKAPEPENVALHDDPETKRKRQLKIFGISDMRLVSSSTLFNTDASDSDEEDDGDDDDSDAGPSKTAISMDKPLIKVKRPWRRSERGGFKDVISQIDELMKDFRLTDETYSDMMKLLDEEMNRGLGKQTHHMSTVRMFPTYVRALPDGSEFGQFIALDLGGTNFRVLLVDLKGPEPPVISSKIFLIPMRIMLGSGTMLFDHIVQCIAEFMEVEGLKGTRYPLGFTFSFPCYQDGLASARLVRWTKGFKCAGVEGEDVVKLLQEAIERRGDIELDCEAIINDPVGALMAAAHGDKNCRVGLILGTGTNCCFMEQLDKVELWDEDMDDPRQVIVNTEWGAFGDNGVLDFIRNPFDRELDKTSLNPGHQLFEKMISGMYMGEIVRLVLCDLTAQGLLFSGEGSEELFTTKRFLTKYISEIESDEPEGTYSNTKLCLQELDIPNFTLDDCRHVQHVCWQVSQRAAFLAATAVATVIRRLNMPDVTVGVDGSLYRFHPHFKDLMIKKITQLIDPEKKFKLVLSHDGSGKGVALVAAVAEKTRKNASKLLAKQMSQESLAGDSDDSGFATRSSSAADYSDAANSFGVTMDVENGNQSGLSQSL